jgi:hypothetical protein
MCYSFEDAALGYLRQLASFTRLRVVDADIYKQCGANDVPSLDALRKTQKKLRAQCRVPTISCTSIQGKNFCINDPKAIIRMVNSRSFCLSLAH